MQTGEEEMDLPDVREVKEKYFNLIDHQYDPVVLQLDYGDPFLKGDDSKEEFIVNSEPDKKIDIVVPVKPPVNWPAIHYTGRIYNPQTKENIAILNINGKEAMLSEGQSASGLKFIMQRGDSIKVSYQQSVKYLSVK
ncbi:hypothetical protein EA772_01490 [Pedobacter sp. G11]|uniref:hypothetical protein n=1 Tax=Pedobacter sp. G11 TaxID=2482728 RepID=UPI000F5E767A|nr:hypothetical protein [Pedobacter sp. G11]AZI24079.1 hypothetical protein EA772_01490 [Pedobacter sp. G11]